MASAKKKIMQWLHPSFPEGSVIVQDKGQSPHPHPRPMWRRQGTPAEIFAKMMCFLKQGKKKKRAPNTGLYKAVLTSQGLWLGHDIKVENPPYSSGFPQVWGSKHPQAPQTCLSQPASPQAPSL